MSVSSHSYPGVYIEEVPSGVRTITGVSTSVTAFVGPTKRGPINKPVRILSYSDFERRFGGLSVDSELSYAVRQFFINGGSEAWVVRLVGSADPAFCILENGGANVLELTALDAGFSGNNIRAQVDYGGSNSSFNLILSYTDPVNPGDSLTETFLNLSMNSNNLRYVESVVNGSSRLISVKRSDPLPTISDYGRSTSGYLTVDGKSGGTLRDVANLVDPDHQQFGISVNGTPPVIVRIINDPSLHFFSDPGSPENHLDELCTEIEDQVTALVGSNPELKDFTCAVDSNTNNRIVMKSGVGGEKSSVEVLPGAVNDLSARLRLGPLSGGEEVEAAAAIRPTEPPDTPLGQGTETPIDKAAPALSYIGSRANREGIYALESVDLFNILCLPGMSDDDVLADAVSYCKERRAFLIVDAPSATVTPEDMYNLVSGGSLPRSDHAAVYYPWIQIADPLNNGKLRLTAPSGAIAGLYARTDSTRGVWKAPAGTDATLYAQGVGYAMTDRENGILNPEGVNCIRLLPVYGTVAWGARTLRGANQMTSEWKYIPVRRLALYMEESLYRGTQWVVFEPNDEPLWAQIRLNVGAFMHSLFRRGAFQGKTPREAYFVKCDKQTTTQDDINQGVVNILVGFAPLKPAEFVIIKISQIAGQIQV
jgi:phage tail sheath protein FI